MVRLPRVPRLSIAAANAHNDVDAADLALENARDGTDEKKKGEDGYKYWDDHAQSNRAAQRTFEGHIARIEIYLHCGKDPACYAKSLDATQDEVVGRLSKLIPSLRNTTGDDVWADKDKKLLVTAEIERAMIELGKLGSQATGQTGALLDHAKVEDVLTRQSIGLALPKIAPRPCPDCVTKLDAAIKAGAGNSALTDLTKQTQVLRAYFASLK